MDGMFKHEKIDYANSYNEARGLAAGNKFVYVDCDDSSYRLRGLRLETYNGTIFINPKCGQRTWIELNTINSY